MKLLPPASITHACSDERVSGTPSRMTTFRCALVFVLSMLAGCGGPGTEADRVGVGAECTRDADCPIVACDTEPCPELVCLTQFSGGYCGLADCTADVDCPNGSACVTHDDGRNYCFRLCANKPECNLHRSVEVEANCSANVVFVEPQSAKACVPPSGA